MFCAAGAGSVPGAGHRARLLSFALAQLAYHPKQVKDCTAKQIDQRREWEASSGSPLRRQSTKMLFEIDAPSRRASWVKSTTHMWFHRKRLAGKAYRCQWALRRLATSTERRPARAIACCNFFPVFILYPRGRICSIGSNGQSTVRALVNPPNAYSWSKCCQKYRSKEKRF